MSGSTAEPVNAPEVVKSPRILKSAEPVKVPGAAKVSGTARPVEQVKISDGVRTSGAPSAVDPVKVAEPAKAPETVNTTVPANAADDAETVEEAHSIKQAPKNSFGDTFESYQALKDAVYNNDFYKALSIEIFGGYNAWNLPDDSFGKYTEIKDFIDEMLRDSKYKNNYADYTREDLIQEFADKFKTNFSTVDTQSKLDSYINSKSFKDRTAQALTDMYPDKNYRSSIEKVLDDLGISTWETLLKLVNLNATQPSSALTKDVLQQNILSGIEYLMNTTRASGDSYGWTTYGERISNQTTVDEVLSKINGEIEGYNNWGTHELYVAQTQSIKYLNSFEQGKQLLKDSIQVDQTNGTVTITFKGSGESVTLSAQEILDSGLNGEADYVVFNLAIEKMGWAKCSLHEILAKFIGEMEGPDVSSYEQYQSTNDYYSKLADSYLDEFQYGDRAMYLKFSFRWQQGDKIRCTNGELYDPGLQYCQFMDAYVTKVNDDTVTFSVGGNEYTVYKEEFIEKFKGTLVVAYLEPSQQEAVSVNNLINKLDNVNKETAEKLAKFNENLNTFYDFAYQHMQNTGDFSIDREMGAVWRSLQNIDILSSNIREMQSAITELEDIVKLYKAYFPEGAEALEKAKHDVETLREALEQAIADKRASETIYFDLCNKAATEQLFYNPNSDADVLENCDKYYNYIQESMPKTVEQIEKILKGIPGHIGKSLQTDDEVYWNNVNVNINQKQVLRLIDHIKNGYIKGIEDKIANLEALPSSPQISEMLEKLKKLKADIETKVKELESKLTVFDQRCGFTSYKEWFNYLRGNDFKSQLMQKLGLKNPDDFRGFTDSTGYPVKTLDRFVDWYAEHHKFSYVRNNTFWYALSTPASIEEMVEILKNPSAYPHKWFK